MKKLKHYMGFAIMLTMLFTSCSKEESEQVDLNAEKATLSFGAILEDLATTRAASKQEVTDLPECSDDVPSYVEIILSSGGSNVVGSNEDPFRVNLAANQIFTVDVPELELAPGNYSLDHFAVYNSAGDLIWLAPRGGALAQFVDFPLPLNIDLNAGVKKYIDVPVICYDNRDVNEYGYLFFELDTNRAIEFCIFGNFCPPEGNGRHYPARFSVDVWSYDNDQRGAQLYNDLTNTVTLNEQGDYAGTPLCVALPDLDGQDEYYFEITLLNSDAYGDIQERVIRTGVITDDEVRNFFDGDNNLEYYHFREGCDGDDSPPIFQNPEDEAEHYKACLLPMNGSTAFGFAYMRLEGNELQTTVLATGLEPGREHMQHIHENASCDNPGPPILDLIEEDGSWPVATAGFGDVVYHRTFTLGSNGTPAASAIEPLENRTVNLHGMTVDGTYNPGIVVACGPVDKVADNN